MATQIDARVKQKTGVAADFAGYVLLEGEIALVRTSASGPVWNFKVGPGNFDDLDWSLQNPGAAQKADTSTVFPSGVPGLYIPTEDGTYEGVTVDLSAGYTQLIWDGTDMVKAEFPMDFNPSKDSQIYPNDSGYKSYQALIDGHVRNSSNSSILKWTGFLPATNKYDIVREGFTSYYVTTSFFDAEKRFISSVTTSGGNGTIPKASIPANTRYIGMNLHYNTGSSSNPDISETARVYTKDSLMDMVDERVAEYQSEKYVGKLDSDEVFERRHGVVTLTGESELVYEYGTYLNGNAGNNYGYVFDAAGRGRTPFWDIRQVNKIILSGFAPNLPVAKFFYDENLQTLGGLEGVNGIYDFRDWPSGAAYFGFTIVMDTIPLTGNEKVQFVYNGDTETIEYYKREIYDVFHGVDSINGQFLTGSGSVVTGANDSWTGYIPIPPDTDLEVSGLMEGFNTKVFWDSDFNLLSTYSINVGTIYRTVIPTNAAYIGFNTRRSTVGDSRSTARLFYVYDNTRGASGGASELDTLAIPATIPVVVGIQANIYKDNLRPNPINDTTEFFFNEGAIKTGNAPNPYVWKTREVERALQYLPTIVEDVPIIAQMRDRYYNVLTQRNFTFKSVAADAGNGQRKTIIIAGDSQIDTTLDGSKSSFAPYLKDMFVQNASVDMVFVGGEPMSATIYGATVGANRNVTCATEGQGSTTLGWLIGEDIQSGKINPFLYGGNFNLAAYWDDARQSGNPYGLSPSEPLDYFLTPSGTNDFSIYGRTPDQVVARMVTLYGLIQSQMPATKLIIGIPTLGSKLWSMDTRRKWSIDYYRALIAEFEKPIYAGKVVLAAAALWTDNLFASRQLRKITEPYQRIVDTKTQLYNKAIQGGMTPEQADELVNDTYNLRVEERVFEKWSDEYPGTNDVTHSGYVGAMQQADCYYSAIKYAITL